jgi:hypothetical protein
MRLLRTPWLTGISLAQDQHGDDLDLDDV